MKKKNIKVILVIIISVLLIVVGGGLFAFNYFMNKEKDSINASEFDTYMDSKNYISQDVKNKQFKDKSYIKHVIVASPMSRSYQIEFYELSNEAQAIQFYNGNRDIFKSELKDEDGYSEVSFANYSKYVVTTDYEYQVVSRIDNTVIYINANLEYKDTLNEMLKTLGY